MHSKKAEKNKEVAAAGSGSTEPLAEVGIWTFVGGVVAKLVGALYIYRGGAASSIVIALAGTPILLAGFYACRRAPNYVPWVMIGSVLGMLVGANIGLSITHRDADSTPELLDSVILWMIPGVVLSAFAGDLLHSVVQLRPHWRPRPAPPRDRSVEYENNDH